MRPPWLAIVVFTMLLAVPAAGAQAAGCATSARSAELLVALESAETAYSAADVPRFVEATDRAADLLVCLSEPLTRHTAARYHRLRALRLFVDRDRDAELTSFAAARSLEPGYVFPEDLVPALHPLLADYRAIAVDDPPSLEVPEPAEGYLTFDGRVTQVRPTSWPTVLQRFSESGAVTATDYLRPGDPLPTYPVALPPPEPPAGGEPVSTASGEGEVGGGGPLPWKERRPRIRSHLLLTAGVAAVLSGASYARSRHAAALYEDPTTTGEAVLTDLRRQTNTNVYGAIGFGALALTSGAGAFVVARW